ncbi:hypothetical protein [Morganella morganii]|uniref:hypothetical protein n=1 Tax=Morganella morganii TaxID=582 RepID=UPI001FFC90D4|nr:hypothetical protein [Morganella morganii]
MKLTKIATVLLFLSPAYLSAATQDFTYRNGYKITADQASPEVNIRIKDNKPTQSISAPNSMVFHTITLLNSMSEKMA